MDDKLNNNIEQLIDSVDYLIDFLEKERREKSDVTDFSSLDDINQNIKGLEQYIKLTQENTSYLKNIDKTLNEFYQNIDALQPTPINEEILNENAEENHFIEIQNEIQLLTNKIIDLSNTLNEAGIDFNVNVNTENLEQIREQLENIKISPLIDFQNVITEINLIKENIESISNLDIKNVDFKVLNVDSIETLLDKIENFKSNISITVKQEDIDNLSTIENILNSIKDIDFKNIEKIDNLQSLKELSDIKIPDFKGLELLKNLNVDLNIDSIVDKLNSIKDIDLSNLTIDININDISDQVDSINSKLVELKGNLSNLNSDITLNVNSDGIKDSIQNELNSINVNIKPTIDLSELEAINEKEYTIKVKTSLDDNLIFNETYKTIKVQNEVDTKNDTLILEQMSINNELLKSISDNLINQNSKTIERNITTNTIEKNSITEISSANETKDVNVELLQGIFILIDKINLIYIELLKNRFDN